MQQADSERSMFGQMASRYGQLANQNYANNLTQQQNYLQNAAQLGQLGNQASQIANDRGGMLSQIGSAMGQLGIDQNKLSYLPMQMQMSFSIRPKELAAWLRQVSSQVRIIWLSCSWVALKPTSTHRRYQ